MDAMPAAPAHARTRKLSKWQARAVAAVIVAIACGLAAYAAAADYETVSAQAASHGVALARLNPLGILGGLFGITLIDIALTWIGRPIWWLRMFARLFAIGVVLANGSAGWPSPVGVGLRVAAPALFVVITEAGRRTLLRADEEAERERKRKRDERVPRIRWLLDLRGTMALWKRMRLWRIRSYSAVVDMELSRLVAIEQLAARYPEGWREAAPPDLVFMLTRGVRMPEALATVAALTRESAGQDALAAEREKRGAAEAELESARAALARMTAKAETLTRKLAAASGRKQGGSSRTRNRNQEPEPAARPEPEPQAEEAVDIDAEARIIQLLAEGKIGVEDGILQLVASGRTPSKAGVLAGRSDSYGRAVARKARELAEAAPGGHEDSKEGTP